MSDNAGSSRTKTLYLIVFKDIMERILNGTKTIEYREITDYWKKRLVDKPYSRVRITNGYGNDTARKPG